VLVVRARRWGPGEGDERGTRGGKGGREKIEEEKGCKI